MMRTDPLSGLSYESQAGPQPDALLLLLHGVGGNETHLAPLAAAQPSRILRVLPRGPLSLGPGRFGWFEVAFTADGPVIDAAQAEASRLQLARLVESLQQETGIGPGRTILAGFSQGGIMSASVGLTRPDLAAGFAILSGRILPELAPALADRDALRAIHAFVSHGLRDATLPPVWADRSDAWLRDLGVPLETRRYPAGHELTGDMADAFGDWLLRTLR